MDVVSSLSPTSVTHCVWTALLIPWDQAGRRWCSCYCPHTVFMYYPPSWSTAPGAQGHMVELWFWPGSWSQRFLSAFLSICFFFFAQGRTCLSEFLTSSLFMCLRLTITTNRWDVAETKSKQSTPKAPWEIISLTFFTYLGWWLTALTLGAEWRSGPVTCMFDTN